MKRECLLDKIMYNTKGQPFKILSEIKKGRMRYYKIQFTETGTITELRKSSVLKGFAKDRYAKDVLGIACIGNVKKVGNEKEYMLWERMIRRCYNKEQKDYKWYGGKGVTVSERWKCFEYFYYDIPLIEGYNKSLFDLGFLQIDKDIKQLDKEVGDKIYSLETCTFVSREENYSHIKREEFLPHLAKTKVLAISPEGEEYCVINIPIFCKEHGLRKNEIYRCICVNPRKSSRGWKFNKIEQKENISA